MIKICICTDDWQNICFAIQDFCHLEGENELSFSAFIGE